MKVVAILWDIEVSIVQFLDLPLSSFSDLAYMSSPEVLGFSQISHKIMLRVSQCLAEGRCTEKVISYYLCFILEFIHSFVELIDCNCNSVLSL